MRLRLLDHAIPALCLILVSSPCLVLADFPYLGFAEPYTDPQCLDGYASAVRYGSPGLWTSFGVVGFTGSSSSDGANYTRVPWTDVVLQTDVHQSWVNIITTIHRSDEDVPLPAVRTTRGDEICVDVTHSAVEDESGIVPDTYVNVTLCTLIIDFSISSNGQTASLMYNSSFIVTYYNISMTEGVTVLSSDVAWSSSISDEYIDCRLWLNNLVAMGIATFLSTLIPILIYWYCPPAVANRKNLPPLRTRAPGQSQLAFVCLRTWDKFLLACTDSYIWGSFCFLAAAVIYIWGRQAPDYLNSHPEFTNVYWVVSAGFYVHSAAFYHMGYDQGTEKPTLADLIECYCNTWGSLGFVVSAVMYMWYDFNNMTRTTNLFELGMYCTYNLNVIALLFFWFPISSLHALNCMFLPAFHRRSPVVYVAACVRVRAVVHFRGRFLCMCRVLDD